MFGIIPTGWLEMNTKGVTIIELLIVIVVVGIIATFAVTSLGNTVSASRIEADSHNLMVLNKQTGRYATTISYTDDIFNGINEDEARINELVTTGFIDRVINVQQDNASFEWNIADQKWELIGGVLSDTYFEVAIESYDWSNHTIDEATDNGVISSDIDKWTTDDGTLENDVGQTNLFIPISKDTYTVTVTANLGEGTRGGYGIFFDTTLRDGDPDHDDGYIFQFDRGYGEGAMIVRPRSNGRESGPVWSIRANNTDLFPNKTDDPDWWTATHTVRVVVTNVNDTTRSASFYVDGVFYGTYEYSNAIEDKQVYTGFRGWDRSPTQFHTIDVN